MKKILVIMIVATAIATTAFAAGISITSTSPVTVAGAPFTPSQNVLISAASITTAYVATSAHGAAASGPGYQFQIDSTYNGIQKKQWVDETVDAGTWPAVVSDATTSIPGFQ